MSTVAEHEARSREVADKLRTFLIASNTGGVGVVFAVAGTLAGHKIHPSWAVVPVALFVLGLVVTAVSMLLAKHRELKRRDAAAEGKDAPDFAGFFWRSYTWDAVSLVCFALGAVVGLCQLQYVRFSP